MDRLDACFNLDIPLGLAITLQLSIRAHKQDFRGLQPLPGGEIEDLGDMPVLTGAHDDLGKCEMTSKRSAGFSRPANRTIHPRKEDD